MTPDPIRLVCLAPAGGSSAMFKSWVSGLPAEFTVAAVDLPGRGARRREPPATSLVDLAGELASTVSGPGRYALFGHSLGGLLAFETGKRIVADGLPRPEFVVLAGSRPPHQSSARLFAPLLDMDDDALIDALAEMGAVNPILRTSPLRALFLPALRSDLALIVGYHPDATPMALDLMAWHADDDPLATPALGLEWSRYTTAAFTHTALRGDHYFPYDRLPVITELLRAAASRKVREPA
ncbi:Thioesterase in siderophore biosynthesis gene cluster [Alloactinosynnema sp. L-07]|uniref:thioesterase II family protein n=1 Tax=Alloactinosynnema sp. L-07 TaxID=1653480 RepID=UPI00065F07BF|nr:alpha/beta fold hydrolase [Alloactinosynnema sp. L-07]CRK62145.1 Thioesterase in siderophore biosynthesis gene cluster [Alloactinosynnema sp. L-07]